MATRVGPRRKPWGGSRPTTWTVDGWTGMYDSRAKRAERDGEAPIIVNMRPLDTDRGGALQVRPGLARLATPTTTQTASAASWQGCAGITLSVGGYRIIYVAGGQVYSINTSTGVVTTELTTAQLTAAVITLNSTLRVWIIEYNRSAVFADMGNNAPFVWDGTTGGGLTKLTNAPAARRGGPTVYYAKLFFIKSDFRTIVWSEENQPNTGYEAGGFNNAWTLSQTSGSNLNRLLGTNEGLYYWRDTSVGIIRGAVSTTFATDGVQDSIAQEAGFRAINANQNDPAWAANAVWWWSSEAHPMVYRADVGALDLAGQLPRRWGSPQGFNAPDQTYLGSIGEHYFDAQRISGCFVQVDKGNNRVHFECTGTGIRRCVLVYDARTLKLLYTDVYLANQPDSTEPWAAIVQEVGGVNAWLKLYSDTSGFLFQEPVGESNLPTVLGFDETQNSAGTAVTGILIGPMHGWSAITEWQFTQLDVLADAQQNNSLTIGYITSRQHKASLTPADQTLTDTATNTPFEKRRAFGLNTNGRWCRPVIQLAGEATANRLPELHGYTLTGYPVSGGPSVT